MRSLTRRRLLCASVALGAFGAPLATPAPARAVLVGGDVAVLTAILTQAIAQVSNLGSMLTQIINQVTLMKTMLTAASGGSFTALLSFISAARNSYNTLTSGVRSMAYTLNRIDTEYNQLFPPSQPAGTTVAQHSAQYAQWNQEVLGAAQIAARQQTTLSTLDEHASQTNTILQQSQTASGVVAQLQLVVQMLGITNAQLITINQTLATTGRVLADMAATGASEKTLSIAKKQDSLTNYTDKGAPVTVPSQLP